MSVAATGFSTDKAQSVIAAGRIVMGLAFIYYGLSKFFFIPGTIAFVGTKLPMATTVFWLAVVIELGGGILLVIGLATRWVYYFYAFYCCFTAVVFHFVPGNRGLLDHFFENFALAGGFLVVAAAGPGAAALDNRRWDLSPLTESSIGKFNREAATHGRCWCLAGRSVAPMIVLR